MRAERWQPLVDLCGPHARSASAVTELVGLLVGEPWRGPGRARSILNRDGVPLQLCLSSSVDRVRLRLIGDPHTAEVDPDRRIEAGVAAARALLERVGSQDLAPLVDATVDRTLPVGGARAELREGALWLAAGVDNEPGAALYTTLEWGDRDQRWERVRGWLGAIVPDADRTLRELGRLTEVSRPVSAAIEGRRRADARAKIYVRLRRAVPLGELGIAELAHPSIAAFVDKTIGERTIPATGLVLSVGIAVATGELEDVKVDVCGHCISPWRDIEDWERLCAWVARKLRVQRIGVAPALARRDVEIAFIGLARRRTGESRSNLYLKTRV